MEEKKGQEKIEREDIKEQEENPHWSGAGKKANIVFSLIEQEEFKRVPACEGNWG